MGILSREFIYIWYYFTVQLEQIFGWWVLGMVIGSAVSVFAKDSIHRAFRALTGKRLGVLMAATIGVPLAMGELVKPNFITQHFEITLKNNGLKKNRFHDLRHSCASLLYANGVSLREIQEWLGHMILEQLPTSTPIWITAARSLLRMRSWRSTRRTLEYRPLGNRKALSREAQGKIF